MAAIKQFAFWTLMLAAGMSINIADPVLQKIRWAPIQVAVVIAVFLPVLIASAVFVLGLILTGRLKTEVKPAAAEED